MLGSLTIRDDAERARMISELLPDERRRGFAEVLIDCEEGPAARAVVVGVLRDTG